MAKSTKEYIVEHLDPELGPWSSLEYTAIAEETAATGSRFTLSSVPKELEVPPVIAAVAGVTIERRSVEEIHATNKERVCLLDPRATSELAPKDGQLFDVFLFGGILGDDPPRDRTSELRKKGFHGRRLGPIQMTTDTAVRVTRCVVEEGKPLDTIPYLDYPELKLDAHESSEMPFRYVRDEQQQPIMPKVGRVCLSAGMLELIKKDSEKSVSELF